MPTPCRRHRQPDPRRRWPPALALTLLLLAGGAPAEPPGDPGLLVGSALVPAEVTAARDALAANPALTAEDRTRLTAELDRVLGHLEALAQANEALVALRETLAAAPGQTATIRARLAGAEPLPDPPVDLPADADLAAVQPLLAQETAAVAAQQDRFKALERALAADAEALPGWRRQVEELRQQALDLDDELAGVLAAGADGAEAQSRRWLLESQRDRLRAEALVLGQQVAGAEVRRALAEAQRDEARLALEQARARQAWLAAAADERRRDEAARLRAETEAARAATADAQPPVQAMARANAELAERVEAMDRATAAVTERIASTTATTAALEREFANDRQRVAAAGMSQALGRVLIDQRERLPDLRDLRRQASKRADAEAESTLAQLRWREELLTLRAAGGRPAPEALAGLGPAMEAAVAAQLTELKARRLELLERATTAAERNLKALAELNLAADALRGLTLQYGGFLAEHLLWLRSHVPLTQQSFTALPAVLAELLRPTNWLLVAQTLASGFAGAWGWWGGLALVVLLLALERTLRRRIRATATPLRRIDTDRFAYTLWAILLTLLLAAPVSLLLGLTGLVLTATEGPAGFAHAVGNGLLGITPALYYLRAFRLLCMPGGVADRHFRWRADTLGRLRWFLDLAIWTLLPLGFLGAVVSELGELQTATLGRLLVTAVTLGFALLLAGALHPTRGVLRELLLAHPGGLASRTRWLWYPLVVAVPLALAGLTLAGFQYTAATLFHLWINQLWLLLGLVVAQQSTVRWLLVTHRVLALRAALERRARREAAGEAAGAGKDAEDELDLDALDGQTRSLVNALLTLGGGVGLWVLWADVLPALRVLERVPLWSTSRLVDGVTRSVPVTLADLGGALIVATGAIVAVRHLPALLEILLRKHTGISADGRYTINTLIRYGITIVAVLYANSRMGLNWQQLQWLVAALGVGIGFGLRDIVATFVSGLIVLFERPVRVGDTVSIGLHEGEVTRIEARATTVRTRDRRDLLVPNNLLVTQEVINWTLTDEVNRGEIRLSIDYGSDTKAALRILAEVAAADPRVLTDPAPVIIADEFGERGIELVLRFFLPALANRLQIRGELILAIDARLRAAGIPIGLPRRDLLVRAGAAVEPTPLSATEPQKP